MDIQLYWTEVTLSLREPLISFETDADCSLYMVIRKGSYSRYLTDLEGETIGKKTDPVEIPPDKLCIKASIPLSAVTGSTADGGLKRLAGAKNIIEFGDDVKEASIILDFANSEGAYKIQDVNGGTEEAEKIFQRTILNSFKEKLQMYFADEIDALKYKLGGLDTTAMTGVTMIPKAFVFAIGSAEEEERRSLNIYVQITDNLDETKAKYKGKRGDLNPSFQPGGKKLLPYPKGCTACVIFSHQLMEQLYFPMAVGNEWTAESGDSEEAKEGICLKLKKDTTVTFRGKPKNTNSKEYEIEEGVIDFNKTPLVLELKEDNASVSWSYQSSEMKYYAVQMYFNIGGMSEYRGKIRVDGSCNKAGLVTKTISQDESVKWTVKIEKKDYQMTGVVTEFHDDFLIHNKTFPESFRKKCEEEAAKAVPSFTVTLDGLNTFVAGNVLFPGKNVFKISSDAGCYAPRDFIIFGNLTEKLG